MILVTGAAGFIGSAIAENLNALGLETITIDDLSTGYKNNIPKKTIFIQGNCGDINVIEKLNTYHINAIIHFAGQSSGEVSFSNPLSDQNSNTTSTLLLLKYAKEKGIKKFIYASSMSVYGDHQSLPVTEESATIPKSFYAIGKLASEHYLRAYSNTSLQTIALRLFNVYGPGQNLNNMKQGMLSIYLAQALQKKEILVKGSLNRFRDLVYIDDVVDAVKIFLDKDIEKHHSVYNISNGYPVKVFEMIEAIKNNLDGEILIKEIEGTPGDQFGIFGSHYRLMNDLSWQPKVQHKEGILKMIEWAKRQK